VVNADEILGSTRCKAATVQHTATARLAVREDRLELRVDRSTIGPRSIRRKPLFPASSFTLFVEREPDGDMVPILFGTELARPPEPVTDTMALQRAANRTIG